MKVIIAGSRDIEDIYHVERAWFEAERRMGWHVGQIEEVVSGKARGVDTLGELWASQRGIRVKDMPADWDRHGKSAGPIRNGQMAQYADALLAIWDGQSKGTKDMVEQMKKRKKPMFLWAPRGVVIRS